MPEIPELVERLRSDGDQLLTFLAGLEDADWQKQVYTDGAVWTIRSVLAHLVTAERAFVNQLFPSVLSGAGGVSADFSVDRYNARQQAKTQQLTPAELLHEAGLVRAALIDWVSKLGEPDLDAGGRHPFLGNTNLREMVKMVHLHSQLHRRDIKRALK